MDFSRTPGVTDFCICLVVSGLFSLTCPAARAQQMTWKEKVVELKPELAVVTPAAVLEACYPFTNTGDAALDVTSVQSDCGCTVPELSKHHYAPGESGVLVAKFLVGERTGRLEKHIMVKSSDAKESTALTLVVNLPQMLRLNPNTLSWSQGEDKTAKIITIEAGESFTIKEITAVSSQALFHPSVRVVEAGRRYELSVAPERTDLPLLAQLPITCVFGDAAATKKTFTAFAAIKAPASGAAAASPVKSSGQEQ